MGEQVGENVYRKMHRVHSLLAHCAPTSSSMAATAAAEKLTLTREVRELAEKLSKPIQAFPDEPQLQWLLKAKTAHEEAQAQLTLQRAQDKFVDSSAEEVARHYVKKVDVLCVDSTVGRHVQWRLPKTSFYTSSSSPGWWALPASIPTPKPTPSEEIALAYMHAKYPGFFCLRIADRVEHISKPEHFLPMGH